MKTEVNRKKSKTKNMIRAEKRAEKIVVQKMTFGGKVANFLEIAFSFLFKIGLSILGFAILSIIVTIIFNPQVRQSLETFINQLLHLL